MKKIVFVLSIFFLFVLYYFPIVYDEVLKNPLQETKQLSTEITQKEEDDVHPLPVTGFEYYIGLPIEDYVERHGPPLRTGPSNFGAEWWTFTVHPEEYVQIEVKNGIVRSIFVMGEDVNTGPIRIGMTQENIYDETELTDYFSFQSEGIEYELSLTKDDLEVFPLIYFENNSFVMLFFHPERDNVYGLRYLSAEALLQTNYYSITSEEEDPSFVYPLTNEKNKLVLSEKEEQLLALFSIMRQQSGAAPLSQVDQMEQPNKSTPQMNMRNYFSSEKEMSESIQSIEELDRHDKVKEVEYVKGYGVFDTPIQFGIFMRDSHNRELLLNEAWKELSIKAMEDDFVILFN